MLVQRRPSKEVSAREAESQQELDQEQENNNPKNLFLR